MYQVVHDPIPHTYHLDGVLVPSVTRITDAIPGKNEWLPAWACKEMGLYLESAWEVGSAYTQTQRDLIIKEAKRAHKTAKEAAAGFGTQAHAILEAYVKTGIMPPCTSPAVPKEVQRPVELFLEWEKQNSVEWIHSELVVGSKRYMFGGKLDVIPRINGRVVLTDFKTSKRIYAENYYQLAGYQIAYEEMEMSPPIEDRMILWIPKTGKKFEARIVPTPLEEDKRVFLAARHMYGALAKSQRTILRLEAAAAQERADGDQFAAMRPAA